MLENCILFSWENRNSKEQTWLVTCSAKMKEGKIIAPNRLVKNCSLYLVCIAWRLEQQKVQNWIRFSGKWETWTLWEEQSSVRSQGKALAWWLPKVCASICCQVPRLTPSRGTCLLYLLYVLMLSFKSAQHLRAHSRKSGDCWTATAGPWPSHGQVDDTFVFNINNEN